MPLIPTNKPPYYNITDEPERQVWEGTWQQMFTNDPTVIVKRNELGSDIIWTRSTVGVYFGTVTGITFKENTFIEYSKHFYDVNNPYYVRIVVHSPTEILLATWELGVGGKDSMTTNIYSHLSIRITNQ